ncbi:hypothetical protein KC19_1G004500 [Ceratodon purpureus]|uniref:Uncharacterized protein n=1 Tax=Ceratodon purpureus TaxID=3225 RepID=A0A8T0IZR4_CERPU|nr:hypothetical protein KC19_1G004500 [Ceratodon purpureus]
MSVNMSCVEVTGVSGTTNGAGQFAMAARNPGAIWLSLQHQVTPHTFMRRKLLNVIDEAVRRVQAGGKKCNARLAVETVNASTSKTSAAPNQFMSVLKFAAHSADSTPDDGLIQKGRAFSSGDDSFIKVLGIFKDLPLDPAALAKLLLIFFLSTQILEEDSSEDAIREILVLIIVYVFVIIIVQQINDTNCKGPNLLREGLQMATDNQCRSILSICSIGIMSLTGAHGADSTEGINQSRMTVEKHDSFKPTATLTIATITIGSVAVWRMLQRRRAIPGNLSLVFRNVLANNICNNTKTIWGSEKLTMIFFYYFRSMFNSKQHK